MKADLRSFILGEGIDEFRFGTKEKELFKVSASKLEFVSEFLSWRLRFGLYLEF